MSSSVTVRVVRGQPALVWGDALAVPVYKGKNATQGRLFTVLDRKLRGALSELIKLGDFEGGLDEVHVVHTRSKAIPARVLLVGVGEARALTVDRLRKAGGRAAKVALDLKLKKLACAGPDAGALAGARGANAMAEGFLLGLYRYDDYKKDRKPRVFKALNVVQDGPADKEFQAGLDRVATLAEAVNYARDLGNRPCNDLVPATLAQAARDLAKEQGFRCTVLDYKKAEALGMHAFCAVAKGSAEPPAFIVLEYNGGPAGQAPIALVGKGLTFDTGGISLKPAENMDEMKFDMCGAGAVLGAFKALAGLKLPINVVGLIPAVENMPGGRAYKPGDVLKTLGGPTIEVRNTDAEGRVVLADALAYAARFKPSAVVDLATLTGAVVVALGHFAAGVYANDRDLARHILAAAEDTGDRCWEMPMWDDYREIVKSDVADVRNSTGRPAGSITAACFLQAFADDYRWAHIDIAGTAYQERATALGPKGATGFGVRLLVRLLEKWPGGPVR